MNYSFSHKNLNHFLSNNNNNIKSNVDKIKKNNFRKDSYCISIEKKRKALGLEFKPNFERELSIQTEKRTENEKKLLLRKMKNNNTNNIYLKSFKNNVFDEKQLIKVRKRDEYKNVEKRFRCLKKIIENKCYKMVKNNTITNFSKNNYNFKYRNDINHKYDINISKNSDGKTNKTIDT
jgi:hypothetical protein